LTPTNELVAHPRYRLGRLPAEHDLPALTLKLTGVVPAHPLTADHLAAVKTFTLGMNDRFGTCGPTMLANYAILTWKALLGEDITVSDEAVATLYRLSGNPGFDPSLDPNDPAQDDNGVVLQDMLDAARVHGLEITHADGSKELVKLVAFAKLADPADVDALRAVTSIFGAGLLGVDLEVAQQAQTDAGGPWDYVARSAEWGAHAIPGGAYTSASAPHAADEVCISWLLRLGMTDGFIAHRADEVWVGIFPVHLTHPAFQQGVDQAAFAADFEALTGEQLLVPPPAPVPPGPAPAPPAPPANAWQLLEEAAESLPEPLRDFIENTLHWLESQAATKER
jgi:hypothetical protein